MPEIFMALGRFVDGRPFIQLFKSTHSISIAIPFNVKEERERERPKSIAALSITEMRQKQLFSRETQCLASFLPFIREGDRRGTGDEFIQSSGGRIYSFTLVSSGPDGPLPSVCSQSEGRHNNVKLGALFPRKYPTDRQTVNRFMLMRKRKTTPQRSSLLPSPLIIPTFSLL